MVLWNRFLQTFDYLDFKTHPVSLNLNRVAQSGEPFALVLSARRPSFDGNFEWLFSENRSMGTMFFRFVLPEEQVNRLTTAVATLDELAEVLKQ